MELNRTMNSIELNRMQEQYKTKKGNLISMELNMIHEQYETE